MAEMTMMDTEVLEYTGTTNASPEEVYRAFTNEVSLREWLSDYAFIRARDNGFIFVAWNNGDYHAAGRYLTVDEPNEVVFSWQGSNDPGPSEVRVTIEANGSGSRYTLTHSGLGTGDEWARNVAEIREGWEGSLENLASVLDERVDLRIARRPFLGIILGGIDDATQERLGLPNKDGILINSTVEGTGAAAAGLQSDDVLVGMAGKTVATGRDLTAILAEAQAGDTVDIEIIRAGETLNIPLLLSKRPFPEVPADGAEFGVRMRAIYDGVAEQMAELLDGVTEEEADHRAGDEWSVKQVLAHMIMSEHGTAGWLSTISNGTEMLNFPNANADERIAAKLEVYPTLAELHAELQKAWDETVAVLSHSSDEFVSRRAFTRASDGMLFGPIHEQTHLTQIREAIEAARS